MKNIKNIFLSLFLVSFSISISAAPQAEHNLIKLNNQQLLLQNIPQPTKTTRQALRPWQNLQGASFAAWNKKGTGLYLLQQHGQTRQLHLQTGADATVVPVSQFDDPVRSVVANDKGWLAITRDRGGNEDSQIWLYRPASEQKYFQLTHAGRNTDLLFAGEYLYFTSNLRDKRFNDIRRIDLKQIKHSRPVESELIFKAPDSFLWRAVDVSKDGKQLLLSHYVSSIESESWLLNLASGQSRKLTPNQHLSEKQRSFPVGFAEDDQSVWLVSDANQDFLRFYQLDLTNLSSKAAGPQLNWDIENLVLSSDRTQAAIVVNQQGYSQLYLMDLHSGAFKALPLSEQGRIAGTKWGRFGSGMAFSADQKRLAFSLLTDNAPAQVVSVAVADAKDLRFHTQPDMGLLAGHSMIKPQLFEYASFDGRKIPAMKFDPRTADKNLTAKKLPVIIYIHGGPESQTRPGFRSSFQMWAKALNAVVLTPNVRGSRGYGKRYLALDNGYRREDSVKDIGALLDWLKQQPDLDAERVAVYGGSYGGYMVLASAVAYSDRLKAAVDVVGISNFVTFLKNTRGYRRDLRRVEYGDERDPQMRKFLEQISPLNHLDKIKIPMLVVQGKNDPRVPASESQQLVDQLQQTGTPVWYMLALNEGHGFRRKENREVYQQVAIEFLQRYL